MFLGPLALFACGESPSPDGGGAPASTTTTTTGSEMASTTTVTGSEIASTTTTISSEIARQLSSAEVYAQVSPSIAFIETPVVSGSAVLIQDGYLVTNHHIVWPRFPGPGDRHLHLQPGRVRVGDLGG